MQRGLCALLLFETHPSLLCLSRWSYMLCYIHYSPLPHLILALCAIWPSIEMKLWQLLNRLYQWYFSLCAQYGVRSHTRPAVSQVGTCNLTSLNVSLCFHEAYARHSLFRVVPAQVYLDNFASDRSHMVSTSCVSHNLVEDIWPDLINLLLILTSVDRS